MDFVDNLLDSGDDDEEVAEAPEESDPGSCSKSVDEKEKSGYVYQCPIDNCELETLGPVAMKRHIRIQHGKQPPKELPQFWVPDRTLLRNPEGIPTSRFKCTVVDCQVSYKNRRNLKRHLDSVHGMTPEEIAGMMGIKQKKTGVQIQRQRSKKTKVTKDKVGPKRVQCEVEGCGVMICATPFHVKGHMRRSHGMTKGIGMLKKFRKKKGLNWDEDDDDEDDDSDDEEESDEEDDSQEVDLVEEVPVDDDDDQDPVQVGGTPVLCFLCCFSFYPKANHFEKLERNEELLEFIQEFYSGGGEHCLKNMKEMSICEDCMSQAVKTVGKKREVEAVERRIRFLQGQLGQTMRELEGKLGGYGKGMGKLVKRGDGNSLEGNLEGEEDFVKEVRNGIVNASRRLEKFGGDNESEDESGEDSCPVVAEMEVEDFEEDDEEEEWSPFKKQVHQETTERLEKLGKIKSPEAVLGIPDPRFKFCMEYNEITDEFKVGSVVILVDSKEKLLECKACGFLAESSEKRLVTTAMQEHVQKQHLKIFQCDWCKEDQGTYKRFVEHVKKEHLEGVKCGGCDKVYYSEEALGVHWKKVHGLEDT